MPDLSAFELIAGLSQKQAELRARGITGLSLFGSRARGDYRHDSDVDILLEVSPHTKLSLLDIVGIEAELSECFGLPFSAILRRSLDDAYLKSIADQAIRIF